ncbi:hypothetical protein E4U47_001628 [Claviceps purpurea]|nr:hypothetical protein E4U28_004178 [Claviceps purpurea]KAG6142253.1 hypothetical protein E4U38_005749 [Claviceps purpurea]KAG6143132.1 hypothetical protein E4U12_001798 [Claviceps purpurea]KAG6196856.1 hypothetical protein E4U50_008066 [Claviceps purpurea]KAG6274105.1 hypothetical protein E4U47_001628 [Claviceps purpurea]
MLPRCHAETFSSPFNASDAKSCDTPISFLPFNSRDVLKFLSSLPWTLRTHQHPHSSPRQPYLQDTQPDSLGVARRSIARTEPAVRFVGYWFLDLASRDWGRVVKVRRVGQLDYFQKEEGYIESGDDMELRTEVIVAVGGICDEDEMRIGSTGRS